MSQPEPPASAIGQHLEVGASGVGVGGPFRVLGFTGSVWNKS